MEEGSDTSRSLPGTGLITASRFDPSTAAPISHHNHEVVVDEEGSKKRPSAEDEESKMPQQEGSGGESASGGGTGGGETAPAVPKSLGPKLTESQLYDLYQRLDINGDGELDMQEFIQVGKKLNFDNETLIIKAFRAADTSSSGKLDTEEFQVAYELLYYGSISGGDDDGVMFVRALRYGIDKQSPAFIMQAYTGDMKKITKFEDYLEKRESEEYEGEFKDILDLMIADGKNNRAHGSRIMWWIDVASSDILPSNVVAFMKTFGLPKASESNFYNEFLSEDLESRIHIGEGETTAKSQKLSVRSLNLFVQTLWLKNVPIVYEVGRWADCLPSYPKVAIDYIMSRISLFLDYGHEYDYERNASLQRAQAAADSFAGMDDILDEDLRDIFYCDTSSGQCIPSDEASPIISATIWTPPDERRTIPPKFLLTRDDLLQRDPVFIFNNLSVHMLDIGFGPDIVLTFRKIDNEMDTRPSKKKDKDGKSGESAEMQSRAGIIGRLLWGVVQKIFIACKLNGTVPLHGELLDSSSFLATTLISLVHNFSMDSIGQLELWISGIRSDMEDLTVTKHIFHIREAAKICNEMGNYVQPFHDMMGLLLTFPTDLMRKHSNGLIRRALLLQSFNPHEKKIESESKTIVTKMKGGIPEIPVEIFDRLINGSKRKKITLNSVVIGPFFPEGPVYASILLDGNEGIEMKGSSFWVSQLSSLQNELKSLKTMYNDKLDEKRNFWGFVLTVLFIYQFPICWLTSFFGMNFDNQPWLDPDYEIGVLEIGGIDFFWFVNGAVYLGIFIFSIDAKILYQAT